MKRSGISGLKRDLQKQERMKETGKNLEKEKLEHVRQQMTLFREAIQKFAAKNKKKINDDPEFRRQFHIMCESIGVDPLASNKGFWGELLGVGDFYYELGVVIIQIGLQTRGENGGIISMNELLKRIKDTGVPSRQNATEDDVKRAIKKIEVLGGGFKTIVMKGRTMVSLVPMEFNNDHQILLQDAQDLEYGGIVEQEFITNHGWSSERFHTIISPLLRDGVVWLDIYEGQTSYMFPSIFKDKL